MFGNRWGWWWMSCRPLKAISTLSHRLALHTFRPVNYVPGQKCDPKSCGDTAHYTMLLENHCMPIYVLMGFINLFNFRSLKHIGVWMPHARDSDVIGLSVYLANRFLSLQQVILMCSQGWEPLDSILNQWYSKCSHGIDILIFTRNVIQIQILKYLPYPPEPETHHRLSTTAVMSSQSGKACTASISCI